ncbi:CPBP family intramembrane glutamic endopeptidase [Tenacibaculum sp. 190524A02b]|uniref:CAAX prenyl protease 2/Lysostaphin resistance protein A-like domain-containing protein n=1 Tax=Tenacibaculum vairaonense TaxID=3137860 RepID=A0ABM9PJ48_9FLAO
MKETLQELITYLKNPVLEKDSNTENSYRVHKFLHLLSISILTSFFLMPLFAIVEHLELIDMEKHAMESMLKDFSKPIIFLFVVVVAPLTEEFIFRGPLTLFKRKKVFKIAFYTFAILFGLIHITNYKITSNVLLLTPILIAPQIILGSYLGFIRVRFGLAWSILLHACYNAFFMLITFAGDGML